MTPRTVRILKWCGIGLGALIALPVIWLLVVWGIVEYGNKGSSDDSIKFSKIPSIIIPGLVDPSAGAPKYTVSDCLVRTSVEYPDDATDQDARDDIGADLMDRLSEAVMDNDLPVTGLHLNVPDNRNLYVLYTKNCDRKFEMTQTLVHDYHRKRSNGARLTVTRGRVERGFHTINQSGPFWIDETPSKGSPKQ